MTKKIYYSNPDQNKLVTRLIEIVDFDDKKALVFEETIFYPEGGGQPADLGTISDVELIDVQIKNDTIFHIINTNDVERFNNGINKEFTLIINRDRRLDHSVQHSAQHLLSAILYDDYNTQTLSFHLGQDCSTVDVEGHILSQEMLSEIEEKLYKATIENHKFITRFFKTKEEISNLSLRKKPKVNENIRIVEIAKYDASPCGGTHVKSTAELGIVKLLKIENYKSNFRISFLAGKRVLIDYRLKYDLVQKLVSFKTCNQNEVYEKIVSDSKLVSAKNQEIRKLKETILKNLFNEINVDNSQLIHDFKADYFDSEMLQKIAQNKRFKDLDYMQIGCQKEMKVIMQSRIKNINELIAEIKGNYAIKGGGSKGYGQIVFENLNEYNKFWNKKR